MGVTLAAASQQRWWNDVVLHSPYGSFLQAWQWGEAYRRLGTSVSRLMTPSGPGAVVAQVLQREVGWGRAWWYVPHGPVIGSVDALAEAAGRDQWELLLAAVIERAEQAGVMFVRIEPRWPSGGRPVLLPSDWRRAERSVQPIHTLVVDVTRSEEELMAAFHQKARYNVRLAQRRGVTVRFTQEVQAVATFLDLASEVARRGSFRYHPAAYYQAMHAVLTPASMMHLAVAEYAGQALAVNMLVTFGDRVTYAHGASGSARRDLMAPHLLQWESMRWAKARGYHWYDLFGVAPRTTRSAHPWAGITQFKTGFDGQRESYVGAYDYVLNPTLYTLFTLARRVRGLAT